MISIKEKIKSGRLYFDGGFGTMLQSMGLEGGQTPKAGIWHIPKESYHFTRHILTPDAML